MKDLDPTLLLECFIDSRQILDLFNQCDFSSYFRDFGEATSKYPRVTPQAAIKVLEKYINTHVLIYNPIILNVTSKIYVTHVLLLIYRIRESDRDKKKILSVLKKDERDKKKLHDTILKQLKELPQTSA